MVCCICRPEPPEAACEPDERSRARVRQAYRLLGEWSGVPGGSADGTLDADGFLRWVREARGLLQGSGRLFGGDCRIGEVIARVPPGTDGVWPHECVRELLEELQSDKIDEGVRLGVVNGRGVTCRSMDDGGEQERVLVDRYERWADGVYGWPRTARLLRDIANIYQNHAQHEDDQRDLNEYWR